MMTRTGSLRAFAVAALACCSAAGCAEDEGKVWACVLPEGDPLPDGGVAELDGARQIGCWEDFVKLSAEPMSAAISGGRSTKTLIDQQDPKNPDALYFQNTEIYPIHWNYAVKFLSVENGLPPVGQMSEFNNEYYSPQRRFLLGALSYYQEPDVWVYEIASYDTASAAMIEKAFNIIKANIYVGDRLYFHPIGEAVEIEAAKLPPSVPVITTDELFAGITYQPLNLGMSMGKLRFYRMEDLETSYLSFRDIAVLDKVPIDISVCLGIITQEFQTPLSHVNVLSQNRGTPNMGLKGAWDNEALRALEDKWVKLTVDDFDWSIEEVTEEEADAWWEEHQPEPLGTPGLDLTVTELLDVEEVLGPVTPETVGAALDVAIPAFGGKASHYSAFPSIRDEGDLDQDGDTAEGIPYPPAFAVPIVYYWNHMADNGLQERVNFILDEDNDEDPEYIHFWNDAAYRDEWLAELRQEIRDAPVDLAFAKKLIDKIDSKYLPGTPLRFRSSTNAEDLDGFTGAGLYESNTGDSDNPEDNIFDAVRATWSAVWRFRAFEEREYRSIDHSQVGMALLVHRSFPDEEANGVAITANIFDTSGMEPGHYINVQKNGFSVVLPDPDLTSDQLVIYYGNPGQPIVYLGHSSLVPDGETVLTREQVLELSFRLRLIHDFFLVEYGPEEAGDFYGMDTEFKFETEPEWVTADNPLGLVLKQARPYPGWNTTGGE
jgi:hypothetical protein